MLERVRLVALLTLVTLPLSGCFFRSHRVTKSVFVGQLKQATLNELIQKVNNDAAKIKTLQLTVDIDTSVGGSKTGKVTEYKEIRGYILLRKPGNLRMQGLLPVVHNRAFDMVSDGEHFRLSVPPKNRFVIGSQEVLNPSDKPFENLRPRQIYDTLIVDAIDTKNDLAVLEAGEVLVQDPKHHEVSEPNYIMTIIHADKKTSPWIERKIYFSREDLSVQKQVLFDREGNAATVGTYNNYSMESGVMLPHLITIDRPQEQYTLQLGVVKALVNVTITDEQFQLPRPEGSELQIMDNVTPDQSILGPPPKSQHFR